MPINPGSIVLYPNAHLEFLDETHELHGPALCLVVQIKGTSLLLNINGKDKGQGLWAEQDDVFLIIEKSGLDPLKSYDLSMVVAEYFTFKVGEMSLKINFLLKALNKVEPIEIDINTIGYYCRCHN